MQTVKFGSNNINYLGKILQEYNPSNILFLTGKSSFIKSGAKDLIQPYLEQYKFIHYFDFEENPKITDVEKIANIFNDNNCDLIIAVGGGTVIDMGKLINFFAKKSSPFIDKFTEKLSENNRIPVVAIPTTSGTGSEATHFAVVYSEKIKYSIANKNLLPEVVFLIPELTYKNPKYLTAVTGVDAFAQAIESYWSINSTKESIRYSEKALKIVWENLEKVVIGDDIRARDELMEASYLAGKAINITKTTAPHALSYGFSTYYNMPHGHAVALFLPAFVKYNSEVGVHNCNDKRGDKWVKEVMMRISETLELPYAKLADEISMFINKCGLSINFQKLNISRYSFEQIVKNVNQERLNNNPLEVDFIFLSGLYTSKFNIVD